MATMTGKVQARDVLQVVRQGKVMGEAMVLAVQGGQVTVVSSVKKPVTLAKGDQLVFLRHAAMPVEAPPPAPPPSRSGRTNGSGPSTAGDSQGSARVVVGAIQTEWGGSGDDSFAFVVSVANNGDKLARNIRLTCFGTSQNTGNSTVINQTMIPQLEPGQASKWVLTKVSSQNAGQSHTSYSVQVGTKWSREDQRYVPVYDRITLRVDLAGMD